MQTFNLSDMKFRYGWKFNEIETVVADLDFMNHHRVWLAGGAIRRSIMGMSLLEHADFDFFFGDEESFEACKLEMQLMGAKKIRETPENISYHLDVGINDKIQEVTIQFIVIRWYDTVEDILNSFDFTLCQFAIKVGSEILNCGDTSLYDVANKRIVINKITYPVASLRRIIKYTKQGFYACQGSLVQFLETVQTTVGVLLANQPSSLD